jgi:hypothetical protein
MGFFFALVIGLMHHVLPADTPGGMVSCVTAPTTPTAIVESIS